MNARHYNILFIILFFLLIISATFFKFPPDWKPAGAEAPIYRPSLSLSTWFSGSFSSSFEQWITHKFGIRGFAIRLAHQIKWSIFRELPSPGATKIDIGNDNWLYEHTYVSHYVKRRPMAQTQIEQFVIRLKTLEEKLKKKNIPLIICIAPSKATIYPEHLPYYLHPNLEYSKRTPASDMLIDSLRKANIPTVYCKEELLAIKDTSPLLFPKNGTHWNAYAAQFCFQKIWDLAKKSNPNLPQIPQIIGHKDMPPLIPDKDLSALYNMYIYPYREKSVPYPILTTSAQLENGSIKILGIGDSFSFQLADAMGRLGIISQFRLLFYNSSEYLYNWTSGEKPTFNKPELFLMRLIPQNEKTIDKYIDNYDLVLIEFTEIFARECAWNFFNRFSE